ncbi:MAG: hypothetical protein JWM33_3624 [Caulobacteraceae bacterium]|nr:hypothetical protein [Caulobacteraceae bacterium]
MSTPPSDAILLGLSFMIVSILIAYGGLKMGSGQPILLIAAGAFLGGFGLGLTGLIRWLWARRPRLARLD